MVALPVPAEPLSDLTVIWKGEPDGPCPPQAALRQSAVTQQQKGKWGMRGFLMRLQHFHSILLFRLILYRCHPKMTGPGCCSAYLLMIAAGTEKWALIPVMIHSSDREKRRPEGLMGAGTRAEGPLSKRGARLLSEPSVERQPALSS